MNKVKGLKNKDLLGLKDLSVEELQLILKTAVSMKEVISRPIPKVPTLLGKHLVTLFYEPSTRTRTSFNMAAKVLSANITNVALSSSSISKGESLIDTAKNLEVMGVDAIIIRHNMAGAAHLLARQTRACVINAGDGCDEHPTQGLLDIFTMIDKKKTVKGKKVVIVGDIAHSRVAKSNIWGLNKLGANVVVVGPPTLMPDGIEELGVKVSYDLDRELRDADFVNMLRIQRERMDKGFFPSIGEYAKLYGLNAGRLKNARPDLVIMHPGPINRGIEMTSEVADGPNTVILEQVTNGVAVRTALLFLLLSGNN
ncbi:aspartate carbamoyltransferase [candidate division WOR-1 bacterium RIFOXYA12_FULL_52_29]|uniref:Aspartate carbamoyltransferase n=1 Tax=candidate division WOR-1 bacterium RIFOXYC12_FULL_54_18 TaxID=1802584 RepID=A0A1F4T6G2_UNCSA|nr:MAG: aspartate carbamoyltransferase [candidate division WOR-1 bacterium RIFOXYA2_FULL_51_19]OGC17905.1 MAG: aspartate carbamoyltransferase [candidate division WOR-1 bacterium RIFOXYA12_FULL_52_29]OGC26761.1 MAG: aspartate carbamoyltransferase [candidate division WOR-1 bacterium RIFOXYB2_FULL_45_9]OGC28322.1 MAG: aspartate carbamoyltransferase [candidate division WOR-1 bacterium RIFOXYC12_FULL_54_18]OGC31222.1 MAG: aspartate carbamoyltransferase [candidate division WOR-1 bacterium RIFOXYB12_F